MYKVGNACFYRFQDLRRIRKSSPLALAKQIAVATVTSKLDFCNSLLHPPPQKKIVNITVCPELFG